MNVILGDNLKCKCRTSHFTNLKVAEVGNEMANTPKTVNYEHAEMSNKMKIRKSSKLSGFLRVLGLIFPVWYFNTFLW